MNIDVYEFVSKLITLGIRNLKKIYLELGIYKQQGLSLKGSGYFLELDNRLSYEYEFRLTDSDLCAFTQCNEHDTTPQAGHLYFDGT